MRLSGSVVLKVTCILSFLALTVFLGDIASDASESGDSGSIYEGVWDEISLTKGWWFWTPGDTVDDVGYAPTQPIPFSHKLHAGERKIPCQYCHSSARRSISGGIPGLNTCMGCHKVVATESEHIKKVTEHYNSNEPIEWVKVHDLPDFVRFSHKIHVTVAGLECASCHGAVERMEVVEQVAPLQMGWCLSCHNTKGASVDCLACHY